MSVRVDDCAVSVQYNGAFLAVLVQSRSLILVLDGLRELVPE